MAPQPFADLEDNHLVIGMETKRMASLWENQLDNNIFCLMNPEKKLYCCRISSEAI